MARPFDNLLAADRIVLTGTDFEDHAPSALPPSPMIRAPVFVVGSPRSGTTVLGRCLGAHPEFATGEESLFLLHLTRVYADLHQGQNYRQWAPLQEYLPASELLKTMREFADRVFGCLVAARNARRYVDHTPWYGSIAPTIHALYPDAHFVHVRRDGRDVVRSLKASRERGFRWAGETIRERTAVWRSQLEACLRIASHLPDQYMEVQYEMFCSQPRHTLSNLSARLGVEFDERMTAPLRHPHATPSRTERLIDPDQPCPVTPAWPAGWTAAERQEYIDAAGPHAPAEN